MRFLINAASAKLGGAVTYITNVLRALPGPESGHEFEVYLPPETAQRLAGLVPNVRVVETNIGHASMARRLWWEQVTLRARLRKIRADVLFSTGGFAMFHCPVRQVLLACNALYFSKFYRQAMLPQHPWKLRLDFGLRSWLARRSVRSSSVVVAPSRASRDELLEMVRVDSGKIRVNPYGAAEEDFQAPGAEGGDSAHGGERVGCHSGLAPSPVPLRPVKTPAAVHPLPRGERVGCGEGAGESVRLAYVSIYSDHKNLTTLLKALRLLNSNGGPRFRLKTTVNPAREGTQWTSNRQGDLELARDSKVAPWVEFVGPLGHEAAHRLYCGADIFVFPSVVESFGHPMMEAMAAGLPIVAADTPVNREVCGEGAEYFQPLSAEDLTAKLRHVALNRELRRRLGQAGCRRARTAPRWREHVAAILSEAKYPGSSLGLARDNCRDPSLHSG